MNLLPKSHAEFSHADYWERFFRKRGDRAFEWYGEYGELCGILHKYIKPADKVLNIGCGNSTLTSDLYDVGYKNIINIDISDVAIKQMTEKNSKTRPDLKFLKMDVYQMEFPDGDFSVVLDKGTLDAIMTDEESATIENVDKMFKEISRVLRVGGRYVCVSLAQGHIIKKVLDYFSNQGWMVRVCRVEENDKDEDKKDFHMPVFVFVLTKFKKLPNMKPILEVAYFDDKVERKSSPDDVKSAITEMQHYGVIRQQLKSKCQPDQQLSLELFSSASNTPRYTLHVVDRNQTSGRKFAVFIVPEGRETEWLFSSDAGRVQLADSAGFERLLVVTLNRGHSYTDLQSIQDELSAKVMELAPPDLGAKKQVPFLSVGDDINKRIIKHRGNSKISGDFVVEDVDCDNQIHRRLIFLSNDRIIQSSARLKKETRRKSGKNKTKMTVDLNYPQCYHHGVMVAGLSLLENFKDRMESGAKILIIGLGGGGLPTFLRKQFPSLSVDTIEIDPAIVKVASDFFGLIPDEKLHIHVADGLDFIRKAEKSGDKWDVIMLDVNSNDATNTGMNCPPQSFVENDFLQSMKAVLAPKGILMVNLICKDSDLKSKVVSGIKDVFTAVKSQDIPDEVNEVLFATFDSSESVDHSVALNYLQDSAKKNSKGAEVPMLNEMLNNLKLI